MSGPFGFQNNFPGGGYSKTGGIQGGPFSASVTQNFDRHGKGGPQTFTGRADFGNQTGSGMNFGVSKTPSFGGSTTVGASVKLHETPTSNLQGTIQHNEHYDKNWNNVGASNSVGLKYQNTDTSVSVGATYVQPIYGKDSTNVQLNVEKKF